MRTLAKNNQKLKYSLKTERKPVYVLDDEGNKIIEYITEDGDVIYKETGTYTSGWTEPKEFLANISFSGGEAEAQEFGFSIADYNAVVVTQKNTVPLEEGSIIWHTSDVGYRPDDELDERSADYTVLRVSQSLNYTKYVLKAIVK